MVALTLLIFLHGQKLRCIHDSSGELMVTKDQWIYIHDALDSRDPKRVCELVHPTRGLKVRIVDTAFGWDGRHFKVQRERWTRADVTKKLTEVPPNLYDARFPGYEYVRISGLSPEKTRGLITGPAIMKGATLYEEDLRRGASTSMWREVNRLAPIVYIRVTCVADRLWLDEVGSDSTAE